MFGKKQKTIFDYVKDYPAPYNEIEYIYKPNYVEEYVSVDHKKLEQDIEEYWDLIHPMVRDYIVSYATVVDKMSREFSKLKESVNNARRNLSIEQQNVMDLNDQVRELKKQLASEGVIRRDLEERLKDERQLMEAQIKQERRTLELLAESKLPEGASLDDVLKHVSANVSDTEEVARLRAKIDELERRLAEEREENEKVQGELSMSFMEKITKYDEMIESYKERLGES